MGDEAQHPTDALQDALDHRLEPAKRAELEAHLASCPSCRLELEALRWTKAQAAFARRLDQPFALGDRVRAWLDEEDRARAPAAPPVLRRVRKLGPWVAAAAAVAAAIWIGGRFRTSSVPNTVAEEYRAYASNALPLEVRSVVATELEAYFAGQGLPFPMRVFDLGMMGYRTEGASVRSVSGREGALVAYLGADGRLLLCRMYEGRVAELPEPLDRRTNQGIAFHLYRDSDVTLVFWQEGDVVCVLAGDGDPEAIIQLAFGKAVKA